MTNLFKKCLAFTDIHFGKRSDSEQHNSDCQRYMTWLREVVRREKPDTIIFMGDWFDNRSRLRLDTADHGYTALYHLYNEMHRLNCRIFMLVGNHDMFYKQNRSVISFPWAESISHDDSLVIIDSPFEIDNVMLCPWMVGTEYLPVVNTKVKYVFGHFELPLFLMNEQVECPHKGGLDMDKFVNCDAVFSGHFHKRQIKINAHGVPVTYIGNCFPHNFNDVGDRDRGCMILEWDCEPRFLNFEYGPNYNRVTLSELVAMIDEGTLREHFNEQSVVECTDDLNIAQEEALEIKEILSGELRDLRLKPAPKKLDASTETTTTKDGKTVDQIVKGHILDLDTEGSDIESGLLLEIYDLSDEG